MRKISVIIPWKGKPPKPLEFYTYLINQTVRPDEIIIVYQGGFDEIFNLYTDPRIRIVDARGTCGANLARNIGLRLAKGDILLFTDNDVKLTLDWVEKILKCFQENGVECIAGGMISANPEEFLSRYLDFSIISPARAAKVNMKAVNIIKKIFKKTSIKIKLLEKGDMLISGDIPLSTLIVTCNFALTRQVVEAVGYFDEDYGAYGSDDIDYAYRILKTGYKILCSPRIIVYHYHRNTLLKLIKRYVQYGLGFSIFKHKHPESVFSKALNYMLLFLFSYFSITVILHILGIFYVSIPMIIFSYSVLVIHNVIKHRRKLQVHEIFLYALLDFILILAACIAIIAGDITLFIKKHLKLRKEQ